LNTISITVCHFPRGGHSLVICFFVLHPNVLGVEGKRLDDPSSGCLECCLRQSGIPGGVLSRDVLKGRDAGEAKVAGLSFAKD
jgi:hypothetical protein